MAEYLIQEETLTEIADAIRSKTGSEESIAVSDMASVIGALAIGGANAKYASGTFTGITDSALTITHNLGIVPDIVIVYTVGYTAISTQHVLYSTIGFSKALADATGNIFSSHYSRLKYATVYNTYKAYIPGNSSSKAAVACIDNATATYVSAIYGADAEKFIIDNVAGKMGYVDPSLTYSWVAIGGLT